MRRHAAVFRRSGTALVAAVTLLNPAVPAIATSPQATACTVTSGSMVWGFKESFRSYVSGSIANGEWETTGGATYETPSFTFMTVEGTAERDMSAATVPFSGGIIFTGHDGLLATSVSNPTLTISGDRAQLALDVSSVPMDQAVAGDTTAQVALQVPFIDVDLSAATITDDAGMVTISVVDAPSAITEAGFASFGSYPADTPFDPLTFAITADCTAIDSSSGESSPTSSAEVTAAARESAEQAQAGDFALLAWVAGGVAIMVGALTAFATRRRRAQAGPAHDESAAK